MAGPDHRLYGSGRPKVASAVWQAIANALPERAVGSACGDCNWFVCGVREPDGKTDVFSDLPAGGWGGTPFNDGMNVTMDPLGNCMNMEAETAELMFPIAYEAFDIRQDSAGDGHHRGGVGSHLKIRFLCEGAMSVETARTREGTPGVNGGQRSSPQRLWHLRADGTQDIVGGLTEDNRWLTPCCAATSSPMATLSGLKPPVAAAGAIRSTVRCRRSSTIRWTSISLWRKHTMSMA